MTEALSRGKGGMLSEGHQGWKDGGGLLYILERKGKGLASRAETDIWEKRWTKHTNS